ncbi:hypothetical protein I601_0295 [Nocardioides dokdonensis FR1436]|uniref:Uncharacterized protein n=1 Tax=Nocardioides dokdonensis FR1436 TaxID=1300347 RepID=A0A1A9GEQ2_9ACTN|nr:STM3941 family protein [Nocardioides dokdonensis]ANH36748.1 hypothetical protein I601_0295 [Nocardioides dokdonensis FR1436]
MGVLTVPPGSSAEARSPEEWRALLASGEPVTFVVPRGRSVVMAAVCLAFTLVGVVMITRDSGQVQVVGLASVLFFGALGLPVLLWQALRRTPQLVVQPGGVWLRQQDRQPVAWGDIERIELARVNRSTVVALVLDEAAYAGRFRSALAASAYRATMGGAPALMVPAHLTGRPDELRAWLAAEHAART